MRTNRSPGIRWKIVFWFISSILLSAGTVMLLVRLAYNLAVANRDGFLYHFLYQLRLSVGGVMPLAAGAAIILAIVWFFFLSRNMIRYLEEISSGLQDISLGNSDVEIPIKSEDELGDLAANINNMSLRLHAAIKEERNAEKSKNELITSVSHDLRTPLTSVLGYLELIVNDRYRDEVELRYYVDIAHEKALRLQNLINDLFEYTKISYGGFTLKTSLIDLRELLEQLVEEFVPALQAAGMQSRLYIPGRHYMVSADGDLLVRVFENLMTNALRYGQSGKYVDIEISRADPHIAVQVANYGEPISEKDLPHLFDRFYRVEQSRSAKTGGSGLGLAIAKSIVELHGGTISVQAGQQRTVFEVTLPIQAERFDFPRDH